MEIYLVGGAVRDKLLGIVPKERDYVVVGATVHDMLERGFKPVGKDFPVFLHPKTQEEYALARIERKVGPGYLGFICHAAPDVSLEDDLKRRDLTINAMAEDQQGNLIDPYGGQHDLHAKCLRHISSAFIEDPVRLLRVARFMARYANLGFSVAPETLDLMQRMVNNGEINALTPERVLSEFKKALLQSNPEAFITTLRASAALTILFPELERLFQMPTPWHTSTHLGGQALQTLKQIKHLTTDPCTIFAALMRNVDPDDLRSFAQRYRIPKKYKELALLAIRYCSYCHNIFRSTPEKCLHLLEKLDAIRRPDRFQQWLLISKADFFAQSNNQKTYLQEKYMCNLLKAVCDIRTEHLMQEKCTGLDLKNKIKELRIQAIERLIDSIERD